MDDERGRELILANGEQATLQDTTQGTIHLHVGPCQKNIDKTDRTVKWNIESSRFTPCQLREAIGPVSEAREGEYLVLLNPTENNNSVVPQIGENKKTPDLQIGRKINIPGPVQLPLWPGQSARVVTGHTLRSNQYVLGCVYNQQAAEKNWEDAIVDVAEEETLKLEDKYGDKESKEKISKKKSILKKSGNGLIRPTSLAIGKTFIIKGEEVAFYIPPTGIEVVPTEEDGEECYIRDAVTLERLEYCALLDESGDKHYPIGPKVVFPEPTEVFVRQENGDIVARAIELNHLMGLYIKVTADYEDEEGKHVAGEELFLKGYSSEKTRIYVPRAEHAIIGYGDKEKIHYAVTVPEGEARYILDRNEGTIDTVEGPDMLLPDPRTNVIVRRVLSPKMVRLLYPGNQEAIEHNTRLAGLAVTGGYSGYSGSSGLSGVQGYATDRSARGLVDTRAYAAVDECSFSDMDSGESMESFNFMQDSAKSAKPKSKKSRRSKSTFVGDKIERKHSFTKPRTLTLNSKYDGAVEVNIWNGSAIMVIDKKGNRRVEIGPKTVLLKYDEEVEAMYLSTGKPKTTDNLFETAYLKIKHNKVSDIILDLQTKDFCNIELKLSYRVNFETEGDTEEEKAESRKKWFDVENYVKFLCDHMRSKIKNMAKKYGIEEFHANYIDLIRDCVLGKHINGEDRTGQVFPECGMRIYDVEVLKIQIGDRDISSMLVDEQHAVVKQGLEIESKRRILEMKKEDASIQEEIRNLDATNRKQELEVKKNLNEMAHTVDMARAEQNITFKAKEAADNLTLNKAKAKNNEIIISSDKARSDYDDEVAKNRLANVITEIEANTASTVEKAKAFGPEIIAALNAFSSREMAIEACKAMAPVALTHGTSVVGVLETLLEGTVLSSGMGDIQNMLGGLKKQSTLSHDDED